MTALSNGNYVVSSPSWDNGGGHGCGCGDVLQRRQRRRRGGERGEQLGRQPRRVTSASDFSEQRCHRVEQRQLRGEKPFWDNGSATDVGAVTFGNGVTGVSGVVERGQQPGRQHGIGPRRLQRRDRVEQWELRGNQPRLGQRRGDGCGAVTFGSGVSGISGVVSAANSLVGTTAGTASAAMR